MEELKKELKEEIIKVLSLAELTPEEIDDDAPLFGDGLGLDSIDVLELIVLMERKYGIRVSSPDEGKKVFVSISAMAKYIAENRTK